MDKYDQFQHDVSEQTERLICRLLDREITAEEQRDLDQVLRANPAARALLTEYQSNDALATAALRHDFSGVSTAPMGGLRRGLWLAAAGAALSMAAVVALSLLPSWRDEASPKGIALPVQLHSRGPVVRHTKPLMSQPETLVDYRDEEVVPFQRYHDIHRDVIGIPGPTRDTIYILERNVQSTRIQPISGEF